jgi:hypothetical protein
MAARALTSPRETSGIAVGESRETLWRTPARCQNGSGTARRRVFALLLPARLLAVQCGIVEGEATHKRSHQLLASPKAYPEG